MPWVKIVLITFFLLNTAGLSRNAAEELYFVNVPAKDKFERTKIANAGFAIDSVSSDSVSLMTTKTGVEKLNSLGFVTKHRKASSLNTFPAGDEAFHDYKETSEALNKLKEEFPSLVQTIVIGKSVEGRDLTAVRISSKPDMDSLPTALFFGCHHAREHLSVEIPLMLAQHLASNYSSDERIKRLLDTTEVYVVPMVNPDGAEYDLQSSFFSPYRYWRKNRRQNGFFNYGVDLNRNYGAYWGGDGSSGSSSDDTYRGPSPFSEPETKAVRDFVKARKNTTVLLTYHTFGELIMWPWGHTYEEISNERDRQVFEALGNKMASWNGYTAQKSSELYLASGDTTDWAYDELNIFAFTFELSPGSVFDGGFYPGAQAIEPTFKANLEPALFLIENAVDPYQVLNSFKDPLNLL